MNKKLFSLLIAGIIFFASGLFLGYRKGVTQSSNVISSTITSTYDESILIKLKNEIKLLNHIQYGEINTAKETLETLLDTDASYLGVKLIKGGSTEKDVIEALKEAKEYRQKHPEHKPNKQLAKTIEEAFQKITKQP